MKNLIFAGLMILGSQAFAGESCVSDNQCSKMSEVCIFSECAPQVPTINQGEFCSLALCICSTDGQMISEGGYCQPQFRSAKTRE